MKGIFSIAPIVATSVFVAGSALAEDKDVPMSKNPEALKKAALMVDTHVANFYRAKKLTVPEVVDDPTFLRRSFLVAAGRIPTMEEAKQFLEISDDDKRAQLVTHLLNSDGYRSHMTNWMFDMLRMKETFGGGRYRPTTPYMQFVRQAVSDNMPWDKLASRLVGSQGSMWDGSPEVGYYIRDKGMPLDNLANTMRVFTGTHMECAQCHDDPFGEFERIDFFHLAAFTGGQSEMNRKPLRTLYREIREKKEERSDLGEFVRWLGDNVYYPTVASGGKGRIKLPRDYQYRDGDPGEVIGALTPYGERVRLSERRAKDGSREVFASWLTSRDNERFNSIIVNRMWKRVMGTSIFEPVDEFIELEKTVSPELMVDLVKLLQDLNYDLKAFQNVLLLTKTYQFAGNSEAFEAGMPQAFNGRQVTRMTAEQVWDSLVTLVKGDPDQLPKRTFSDTIFYKRKPVLVGKKTMSQLSRELIAMETTEEVREYASALVEEMKGSGDKKKKNESMMSMGMMSAVGKQGPVTGLARASELASPAPAGHLLREFGQSDRELLDTASREPNMTQVLTVMNGHVEKMVVSNSDAALYQAIEKGSTDRDKVRYLFYSILSRPPSDDEMEMLMRDVIDGSEKSYRNLASALFSTHEFIFIQ